MEIENSLQITDGKLIIALSRALKTIHHDSETLFRQNGLTMSQFAVLEALLHKGSMTVGALIETVLSNSGNMTVVVKNLERDRLVLRKLNPSDGRSYLIALTEKGKDLIQLVFPSHMQLVRKTLSALDEDEELQLIKTLKKLNKK